MITHTLTTMNTLANGKALFRSTTISACYRIQELRMDKTCTHNVDSS